MNKKCLQPGCGRKHYAKGLCWTHYVQVQVYKRSAAPIKPYNNTGVELICSVEGCNKVAHAHGLCPTHNVRLKKHGDVNIVKTRGRKRTTGTGSEYPNHSLLKKNRLIKLKMNPICEYCGELKSKLTHHRDGTKTNHSIPNLMALCGRSCHVKVHNEMFIKQNMRREKSPCKSLAPAFIKDEDVEVMFIIDQLEVTREPGRIEISQKKDI